MHFSSFNSIMVYNIIAANEHSPGTSTKRSGQIFNRSGNYHSQPTHQTLQTLHTQQGYSQHEHASLPSFTSQNHISPVLNTRNLKHLASLTCIAYNFGPRLPKERMNEKGRKIEQRDGKLFGENRTTDFYDDHRTTREDQITSENRTRFKTTHYEFTTETHDANVSYVYENPREKKPFKVTKSLN